MSSYYAGCRRLKEEEWSLPSKSLLSSGKGRHIRMSAASVWSAPLHLGKTGRVPVGFLPSLYRRLLLPSTGWSSSVQSGLALEPTPDNSSGPSKVRLWKTLHLPPWSLGALSSHVWSSTAVTLLCCELAKWGGCRKVRCLASPQLFQLGQYRCQTCDKPRWEQPCWAQSTHRNMRDPPSTNSFKNLRKSL